MVFDELLANVISYAYSDEDAHSIEVIVNCAENRLTISISDDGMPFNPFTREDPDITLSVEDREIGGLGIMLVKNTMDETGYQRRHNRNIVTLIKHLDS
jgi:anti-sigma regulatory factor (Ser/Thr protein kinase)